MTKGREIKKEEREKDDQWRGKRRGVKEKEKQRKNDGNKVKARIKGGESKGFWKTAVPGFDEWTHHSAGLHSHWFLITAHILIQRLSEKKNNNNNPPLASRAAKGIFIFEC